MAAFEIDGLDHFVMPVSDVAAAAAWYERVLGMRVAVFKGDRVALHFGDTKINLHPAGRFEHVLRAPNHLAGTSDFCLTTRTPIEAVKAAIEAAGVEIVDGPVLRDGARGRMTSIYFRDPDGNLVEIANYGD
jgi:catechol 2,3-dioxygenase-like lactoylglutathione lyase family enzyme